MIRFYQGKILPLEKNFKVIKDGEVWVNGSEIAYVGPATTEEQRQGITFQREINLKGNLLMPGFKNAHTHSPMSFLRSKADDMALDEWLHQLVFPLEEKLTPDMIYDFTQLSICEYLTSGITASFDMYVEPEANARANIDMGFRTVLCGTVNDFKDSVEQLEQDYHTFNHMNPLISYQLGFHAEYTTSKERLKGISQVANQLKAPVYAHMSETEAEVKGCIGRYHMTPVELMEHLGMWNYGGGIFHGVYLTARDMEYLKQRGIYVVTNPASNLKLASGIAPIEELRRRKISLAIGTDGPASNNCLDMFREMFLVTALSKVRESDAGACPANHVLYMATVGGAKAMGLHHCDCIAVGKQADLVVLDLMQPNMQPENHLVKNIVYSGSKSNVTLTMVAGRILYENGEFFTGVQLPELYSRVRENMRRLQG